MIDRIRKIFKESGLTQKDFAVKIGLQPSSFNDLLNERAKTPSADTIIALYEVFDVSPLWLLVGIGPERIIKIPNTKSERAAIMDESTDRFRKIERIRGAKKGVDLYLELNEENRAAINNMMERLLQK